MKEDKTYQRQRFRIGMNIILNKTGYRFYVNSRYSLNKLKITLKDLENRSFDVDERLYIYFPKDKTEIIVTGFVLENITDVRVSGKLEKRVINFTCSGISSYGNITENII